MSWCQWKTAYLLETASCLTDACADDEIFSIMDGATLPDGWAFKGYDIAGAAGFVLVFEIDGFPIESDTKEVESLIKRLEKEIQ